MRLLPTLCLSLAATMPATTMPAAADPVVVELFTSQGCSSCPPADEMLGMLAEREDVIALAFHVDYWDWIGWKDTFADPAYSDRQRAYAAGAGSSVVYTPQFVVGGQDHVAGAKGMSVARLIEAHSDRPTEVLEVEDGRVTLSATGQPALLILAEIVPVSEVSIERGENAGRDMVYHNIVRGWAVLSEWDGADGTMPLPPAEGDTRRVVLAQVPREGGYPGRIIGAAYAD